MPLCKIYNSENDMICSFSPEDSRFGGKLTIGCSGNNSIVLSEEQGVESINDVHFAIIEIDKGKWRISAAGEECLLKSDGEIIREIDLRDKLSLEFGNCRMEVEDNAPNDLPYHIIIETEKGNFISRPLLFGVNTLGSGASASISLPENTAWGDEHLALDLSKDGKITLEDRGSENGTFVKCKKILKPTPCEKGETFMIGCTNACVVDLKNLKAIMAMRNPFKRSSAKWYKASLFSFVIIIILTIAIILQPQKGHEQISEKSNDLKNLKDSDLQILTQEAWLAVSEGYPEYALNLLSPSRLTDTKAGKLSKTIELIKLERDSLNHLLFFRSQIADFNFDKLEDKIIEAFAESGPSESILSHNIEYLKTALTVMEKDKSLIEKTNSDVLKKNSSFLKKMKLVKSKIEKISGFLNYLLQMNELWNKKQWADLNSFLEKENEQIEKSENFSEFIKNLKDISNFAIKISENQKELENKDFFTASFSTSRDVLNSIEKQNEEFKKVKIYKQKDFAASIGDFSDLLDQLEGLKASYSAWEADPSSLSLTEDLDTKVDQASLTLPVPPVIAKAKPIIEKKILKFLSDSMSTFNPPVNSLGISQIKEKIKYCDLIDLNTKEIHKKLEKMLAQNYSDVLKKCNLAYAEYTSLRENGNLESARKKLAKIQEVAPDGSRFKKWAESELKLLNANDKKKTDESSDK